MTEFATRTPLQTLSMSSSQRGPPAASSSSTSQRRSARLAFDEEEHAEADGMPPPPKRAKVDEGATGGDSASLDPTTDNRKATASGSSKAKAAAYNEDIDGFTFTRGSKPKKATNAKAKPSSPAKAKAIRTSPQKQAPPKRRSARLSGEKAPDQQIEQTRQEPRDQRNEAAEAGQQATMDKQETSRSVEERGRARTPTANEVRVEKKRAATKIALPFADTPVMARNKAMRKSSAESRRRSSSQLRGRRASSLIDSGASNALPHEQVEVPDFYKHIKQDLPEPRRMRQLLVWCGTRALPERPSGPQEDVNAALAARVIQEEILQDFSNKSEMSDWFSRDDVAPTALVKRPNPRNVQNATKLQELEREVERLKEEQKSWDGIIKNLSASVDKEGEEQDSESAAPISLNHLSTEDQSSLKELEASKRNLQRQKERLEAATTPLEFKLDYFAERIHKLEKYKEVVDNEVEDILSESAQALEEREKTAASNAGTQNVGVRELLRSLSRAS